MRTWRTWAAVLHDGCVFALSFYLAFWIRFEGQIPDLIYPLFLKMLPFALLIRYGVTISLGVCNGIFQYASINDLVKIIKATTIGSAVFAIFVYFLFLESGFPRSVFVIDWFFVVFLSGLGRFGFRMVKNEHYFSSHSGKTESPTHPVLVVGAGDAGEMIVRDLKYGRSGSIQVVGFVDDDPSKLGTEIHEYEVLGKIEDIPSLVKKYGFSQVLIAIPTLPGKRVQRIVQLCRDAGVKCLTLPSVEDIVDGNVRVDMIREVNLNDLIRRNVRRVIQPETLNYIQNKKVLVTGAAGSIGSEIVRQLLNQNLESLILVDQGETPIFHLKHEINRLTQNSKGVFYYVADIRDRERIESIFAQHQPEVVFHAAAYKHVPLMEENPQEAFKTNCFGTQNLADLSHANHVETFVMLSTDKAADPVNFMGASKRLAEKYIQSYGSKSSTRFVSVRFGNVLGSRGSVVPLFQEMIRKGGPIKVTDSEIERFFMTVEEAAELVLHAGGVGKNGHILVLEMGTPLKIKDLAEELIRLSGLVPYEDIDIVYSGLRLGERKTEIIIGKRERLIETGFEFVQTLQGEESTLKEMETLFQELKSFSPQFDKRLLLELLKHQSTHTIDPEYDSTEFFLRQEK